MILTRRRTNEPTPSAASPSPSPGPTQPRSHVPALDGVRGIAIILVMAYHFAVSMGALGITSPLLRLAQVGWCGVDVFFALSGFLITGILIDTKSSPHYFRDFYARRVLRIFPLYYGSLLVVFLLRIALPEANVWGAHDGTFAPASLVWPVLFLQNAAFLQLGGSATGVTAHYWSLAVEEHFYLAWPLLVWLTTRRQLLAIAFLAAGFSIAARAALHMHGIDFGKTFGLTPVRLDGLAIGAIAALAIRSRGGVAAATGPALIILGAAGALLFGLLAWRHTSQQSDPALWVLGYPLVATATAAALVASLASGRLARLLSCRPLRWFGKYSFGLYVWHPLIGMLLFHSKVALLPTGAGKGVVLEMSLLVFVVDLLVAWLSFHLWEKHFLEFKKSFGAREARALPVVPADTQIAFTQQSVTWPTEGG